MYEYKGIVTKVVDGDTIDVKVDLGFYVNLNLRFRLARINAPETRGKERPDGLITKSVVKGLIENKEVTIESTKTGKYGRWIAEVTFYDEEIKEYKNLSDYLLENKLARVYD